MRHLEFDLIDDEQSFLRYEISDEALEAAAFVDASAAFTLGNCTGLDSCPAPHGRTTRKKKTDHGAVRDDRGQYQSKDNKQAQKPGLKDQREAATRCGSSAFLTFSAV